MKSNQVDSFAKRGTQTFTFTQYENSYPVLPPSEYALVYGGEDSAELARVYPFVLLDPATRYTRTDLHAEEAACETSIAQQWGSCSNNAIPLELVFGVHTVCEFDVPPPPAEVLSPRSFFRSAWDAVAVALVTYSCVSIPVAVFIADWHGTAGWWASEQGAPPFAIGLVRMDTILSAFFLVDLVVSFVSAYEDENTAATVWSLSRIVSRCLPAY